MAQDRHGWGLTLTLTLTQLWLRIATAGVDRKALVWWRGADNEGEGDAWDEGLGAWHASTG